MRKPALLALAVTAAASALAAQPVLVKDIRTRTAFASLPDLMHDAAPLDTHLYFRGDDGFFGTELWRSDGTAAGTRMVADLCPGRCSGRPERFTAAAGLLFFLATDDSHGQELWRSDGTAAGTFPLVDVEPGPGEAFYAFLARYGERLLFATRAARDGSRWALWTSDGTREGTHAFTEIEGFLAGSQRPAVAGGVLVFAHHVAFQGWELWRTDGTDAGTGPMLEIRAGVESGIDSVGFAPLAAGGRLYFAGNDGATGWEPWSTDGRAAGTRRVADIVPGTGSSLPFSFTTRDGEIVFHAETPTTGRELWRTDGTAAGTRIVADIRRGPEGSTPAILASARGRLLFAADDGAHGLEPWLITASGALLSLGDLNPGPAGSITLATGGAAGGFLYFAAETPATGRELWRTDGTRAGTRLAGDLTLGSTVFGPLHPLRNRVLFGFAPAGALGAVLFGASAGEPATTAAFALFHRRVGWSDPRQLTPVGTRAVFVANDGVHGPEPWTTNGLRGGTALLGDLTPAGHEFEFGGPSELTAAGDRVFFFTSGLFGDPMALWTTRGVPGDARLLRGRQRSLHGLQPLGGGVLFFGSELRDGELALVVWRSDGTPAGTRRVATAVREAVHDFTADFFVVSVSDGARVWFVPHDPQDFAGGLWASDGTAAGTREAVPDPCGGCRIVSPLRLAAGRLFYLGRGEQGDGLWTSDGTPAGTRLLFRVAPLEEAFNIGGELVTAGGRAFFVVASAGAGQELWTSDGTPEGTRRVADLRPGPESSSPSGLTPLGDRVFFAADDGVHGRELWVSDGTEAGTRLVEDVRPGERSSHPQALRAVDGVLVLAADDGAHGLEPWRSDGTAAGTRLLGDVLAGPLSSSPRDFASAGPWLLFNAGRPAAGYELFRLPRALLAGP